MKKILSGNYPVIAIYLFLAVIAFGKLAFTFFQQDEWAILGRYLYWAKANVDWFERFFASREGVHMIPLSSILSYFEYRLFGLHFSPYAYFSIGIHLLNVGLVYYLAYLFFKKRLPAFIAGLVFLVDFIPSQAITWIATTTSTAGATLLTLLSLIFLTKFLLYKRNRKFIVLSFVFLFLSLLFKESSIFLFPFIFIYWFVFDDKRNFKRGMRFLKIIFFVGGLYIFSRFFLMSLSPFVSSISVGLTYPSLPVYIYRIITLPFKAVAQSIIPTDYIISLADKLVLFGYPNFVQNGVPNIAIAQSIGSDVISYALALIILLICIFFYKKAINNNMAVEANIILISIIFIALNSLPLIFIPGNHGYFSFLDGRYLYLGGIFKSILLANIFLLIYHFFGKKKIIPFCLLFFVFFTVSNVLSIRRDLNIGVWEGRLRQSILHQIQQSYPTLPKKVIFYTESDSSYYGLPIEEKILPFLSGFGQTLLVWYDGHGENFPACFYENRYLYNINEEGYKFCNGRGFGYFRKFDSLTKAITENKLSINDVIGFKFNSSASSLQNITDDIRNRLAEYRGI